MKILAGNLYIKVILILFGCFISLTARGDEKPLKLLAVDFPPYEFETPVNGLKGFDVEVVEEVFRRIGKSIEVEFLPWSRAVKMVYAGKEKALLTCGHNTERDKNLYFSDPISVGTHGYFIRTDYPGPELKSLEELRGLNVAAVQGYSTQKALEELGIEHAIVRTDTIALNILLAKRIDFYYAAIEGNLFIANQMDITDEVM
ncbi:substrate-binding periplasmic protein [Kiloniella sp.]|uniref:substrate-binding periplasmic protein n=1 Tax=Kiloniella sp. TaxID=1938587 RepID=UPI003B01D185